KTYVTFEKLQQRWQSFIWLSGQLVQLILNFLYDLVGDLIALANQPNPLPKSTQTQSSDPHRDFVDQTWDNYLEAGCNRGPQGCQIDITRQGTTRQRHLSCRRAHKRNYRQKTVTLRIPLGMIPTDKEWRCPRVYALHWRK